MPWFKKEASSISREEMISLVRQFADDAKKRVCRNPRRVLLLPPDITRAHMSMAGHASFDTTRRFYLAYQKVKLLTQTRLASSKALASISVAKLLHKPFLEDQQKKQVL
jgi:hypothetical protein